MVSLCPFRFLGLCLATPLWPGGLPHNPLERPPFPCKQCIPHSSETLWPPLGPFHASSHTAVMVYVSASVPGLFT